MEGIFKQCLTRDGNFHMARQCISLETQNACSLEKQMNNANQYQYFNDSYIVSQESHQSVT